MRRSLIHYALLLALAACGGGSDNGNGPGGEPKGPKLSIVSGDQQTDTVTRMVDLPLVVRFRDTLDQPVAGASVVWSVVSGGGTVTTTSTTGADGQASATYTMGQIAKDNSVRAFTDGAVAPVFFTLHAVHDAATQLIKSTGDSQYAEINKATVDPYVVKVADQFANGVPGVTVQWSAGPGQGTVSAPSTVSDAAGLARTTHTVSAVGDNGVTATIVGTASNAIVFHSNGVLPVTLASEVGVPENYGAHDTFVRDGLAFHCAWNTGMLILDVGNGIKGGSPTHPVEVSRIITAANGVPGGPSVHNAWWFHNPVTGEKRYVFVGQEGEGFNGGNSAGDIHVVDVSDLLHPVEVAYFTKRDAGTHNFWMDEPNQILYVGYYRGGVVAIDVSGTLSGNIANRQIASLQVGGPDNTSTWGVQLYNGSIYASDMLSGFFQLKRTGFNLNVVAGGNNIDSGHGIGTDLWVANGYAYTGFSSFGYAKVLIWKLDATGAPIQIGSIPGPNQSYNVSDVEVSPSGKLLMYSIEGGSGAGYYFYNLSDPANPKFISRYLVPTGLHTATFGTINGKLYAFGAKDPPSPSLLILDVSSLDL
jgi:hypothetical protein